MKIKSFRFVVFSLLIIFAVVSFGGCGGSSKSSNGGNSNGGGGGISGVQYSVLEFNNPDTDGDGTPDVLDFDDVDENSYIDEVITDRKISVPSRNYIARLKSAVESPDSFIVDLTAGTEYTVEISKGLYDHPIVDSVPNVEIINPQGNTLTTLDLGTFDENYDSKAVIDLNPDVIELSVYPQEEPYVICLTFTPASTGSYKINLNHAFSDENEQGDAITLFVYKELRNEDTGEAGYYKRFKFEDRDGDVSATISMTDIMELRKAYYVTVGTLMRTYLELVLSGDVEWNLNDLVQNNNFALEVYDLVLQDVRQRYGLFDVEVDDEEAVEDQSGTEVSSSAAKKNNNNNNKTQAKQKTVQGKKVTEGKLNINGTSVPSEIVGIPYEDRFSRGTGFFGVTGIQASYKALKGFTLPVPTEKNVRVRYTSAYVSSQEERESFAKTAVNASVKLGGFGAQAGYSASNSFKYGLTSTTFVIHYEELESDYRYFDDEEKYQLTPAATTVLQKRGTKAFRERFGDYFVAGYKYGGTYDAFISVTTETTEQLDEVKAYLQLNYNGVDKAASADVGRNTKDFLKSKNALVTVEITTAGINTNGKASNTISADVTDIASQLEAFQQKLKASSPKDYLPCYVKLMRYGSLSPVMLKMMDENDDGLIPIPASHSSKVFNFNQDFMIMQSYYNVIKDLGVEQINLDIKNALVREYNSMLNEIQANGNNFYMENNAAKLEAMHEKMLNLSERFKAIGDRYAFYKLLVGLQKKEKTLTSAATINGKVNMDYLPYGRGGGNIGIQSYRVSTAVESDFNAGKWQNDSVYEYNAVTRGIYDKTFDAGDGYVFCYLEVTAPLGTWDYERIASFPTIASRTAKYHFEAAPVTYSNWKFRLKTMRFNSTLYPFRGLED